MPRPNRHLMRRGAYWYYKRRIPTKFRAFDERGFVKKALDTDSLEIARLRRDALEVADNEFWSSMAFYDDEASSDDAKSSLRKRLGKKYGFACSRALARGFVYAPAEQLVETSQLSEIMDRIQQVKEVSKDKPSPALDAEATALLGGVDEPKATILEAFEVYREEIAVGDLLNKSPTQKASWLKSKTRGINNFLALVGDKPIAEITRDDARIYYKWWAERLLPTGDKKPLTANSANRDIGNMRLLYTAFFTHIGQEDRENPFRNLWFKDESHAVVPAFKDDWVRKKLLVRGVFETLNSEAAAIVYALIETGCRPAEIANLSVSDIKLNEKIPYIHIRPRKGREIKTYSSIRQIPLVGVSLEAMETHPEGFPHYRDRNDLLSASLMKYFRTNDLFPTSKHVIYSIRHAFEKRMLEADLDYGFRCMMMGRRHNRPKYGDGESMVFRRDQLLKIVHPFPGDLFG